MQRQNPKSQFEKRMDSLGGSGGDYTAGVGIIIDTPDGHTKRIMLQRALGSTIGGVAVSEQADFGVKMSGDIFLALKNPTSMQTGGIKLGDGLVPYLGFNPNTGFYAPGENCIVHLRLSDGLKFIENNEEAEKGTLEYGENTYGGRAVSLNIGDGLEFDEETGAVKATGYGASFGITILNGFISVKIGEDFEFSEDGSLILKAGKSGDYTAGGGILISSDNEISVNVGKGLEIDGNGAVALKNDSGGSYSAGNGIEISDENEISTKIGEGLEFGSDGAINALPNIENAVIISQADARYLLHNYTEIKYTAGNRIGYAGGQNQIIAQGYILYKNGGTAPNGTTIAIVNDEDLSLIPDIQMYTDMQFPELAFFNNNAISRIYMKLKTVFSTNDSYSIVYVKEDGSESNILESINNYDNYSYGFALLWNQIQPPGYTSNGVTYPYGCAICTHAYRVKPSKTKYYFFVQSGSYYNIGFANEAEYNAAVGLTYEPIELTQVQETVTEV